MTVKERLLTIRLMEKLEAYPEYAIHLGLEVPPRDPPSPEQK